MYLIIGTALIIAALVLWSMPKIDEKKEYDEVAARMVFVKEETHHQHLYWFNETTDQFLLQGRTIEDIIESLKLSGSKKYFILGGTHILMAPDFIPQEIV